MVEVADALTDLLYVVYGAGHAFGIDLDDSFREVHVSNMSKLGEDGKPIYREDGKVMKGPKFKPPALQEVLDKYQ
jgi:predicted HAD superfamily Cof-like phosphohydrolase